MLHVYTRSKGKLLTFDNGNIDDCPWSYHKFVNCMCRKPKHDHMEFVAQQYGHVVFKLCQVGTELHL